MNCPACNQRNPSNATTCLHCGIALGSPQGGFISGSSGSGGMSTTTTGVIFVAFVAVVIVGLGYLYGFDRVETECASAPDDVRRYEADPEWERDQMEERRRMRKRNPDQSTLRRRSNVRCYRRVVEHVDGALQK